MQECHVQPLLTVNECMKIAADLRLDCEDDAIKNELISEILDLLKLTRTRKFRISKLSGGEKKRLSIAVEMVNNPDFLYLDEPTTGLDSVSCHKCMEILKNMAISGKTIVSTIHQPSALIFDMFDYIYVLSNGMFLYQGHPKEMIQVLEDFGADCPAYHNPVDIVIEIANGEYGNELLERLLKVFSDPKDNLNNEEVLKNKTNEILPMNFAKTPASCSKEMQTLLYRELIKAKRNPTLTYLRLLTSITNSLVCSSIFWKVGSDASKIWFNYNCILGFVLHLMMPSLMLTVLAIPSELLILKQEYFNRWYSLKNFYIAISLIDLPISIIYCLNSNIILYYLTDQPLEWFRFIMFTLMGFLLTITAQSLGLLIGTIFDVTNGTFIASAVSFVMLIFGGFFITLKDIPSYLHWFTNISYIKYGVEGMVDAVNGYNRTIPMCSNEHNCIYTNSELFMTDIGLERDNFWLNTVILLSIFILLKFVNYFVLKHKLQKI